MKIKTISVWMHPGDELANAQCIKYVITPELAVKYTGGIRKAFETVGFLYKPISQKAIDALIKQRAGWGNTYNACSAIDSDVHYCRFTKPPIAPTGATPGQPGEQDLRERNCILLREHRGGDARTN